MSEPSHEPEPSSERSAPFLEARGIVKRYAVGGASLPVLRDLDLDVAAGEMVAIVGASGVGKSTLLHVLGGLDRADHGSVRIGDTTLTALDGSASMREAATARLGSFGTRARVENLPESCGRDRPNGNARDHVRRLTPRDQQRMDDTHLQDGIEPCTGK